MLEPGTRIGPYEVLAPLGAGGMGEVVRARDTRLGREVALKTLPDAFAADPERLARFEREARLLASLHHPNIAAIFGVEEAGGHRHLVLELVEGATLAERIDRGPLPVEEALEVARQIATALEFAHEHGVIHRDLKPGNVKITPAGEVKVLDFGLAKGQVGSPSSSDLSNSPTMTASPTGVGVILGTAAYMSPEQARGRPVDRRTDIWSFGCVLFEMLTGRQLFVGETVTDVLARILQTEPDWTALPAATPMRVRALLARCLRKDPKERLRDIGDARIEVAEVLAAGPAALAAEPAAARRGPPWPALAGMLALGALLTALAITMLAPRPERVVRRFVIEAPGLGNDLFLTPALSHSGRALAYAASGRIWVRTLDRFEPAPLPGTEGAGTLAWSPDDHRLSFERDGKLWVIAVAGGPPTVACTLPDPGTLLGCDWSDDGHIVFTLFRGGLYQVAASGGEPRLVCAPRADEEDLHEPNVLPDGRHVVLVGHRKQGAFPISVISLADGKRTDLRAFDRLLAAVYSREGWLLLYRQRPPAIEAIRFSAGALRLEGEPVRIAPGGQIPTVSADGTMAYQLDAGMGMRQMVWLDARGHLDERVGEAQTGIQNAQLSPDGRRVVYTANDGDVRDLFVLDLARGIRTRVLADSEDKLLPMWSADGRHLYYNTSQTAPVLWELAVDGSTPPRRLVPGYDPVALPDGRGLLYVHEEKGRESVWRIPLDGPPVGAPLWRPTGTLENAPALSRDGRWLAYTSDESGTSEVYVRAYPGGEGKQLVSRHGGAAPFWAPDGSALYYAGGDTLFRVGVRAGGGLALGEPRALFARSDVGESAEIANVGRDGRLLATFRSPDDPRRGILVVQNWSAELRRP